MLSLYQPNDQKPRLIRRSCGNLQQHGVTPECLSLYKVNAVFNEVGIAFGKIELK